jgi:hypothetical protein
VPPAVAFETWERKKHSQQALAVSAESAPYTSMGQRPMNQHPQDQRAESPPYKLSTTKSFFSSTSQPMYIFSNIKTRANMQQPTSPLKIYTALLCLCAIPLAAADHQSKWINLNQQGKLEYGSTPRKDRISDFSYAGYRGGGIALPTVATKIKLSPGTEPDDTPRIQAALDQAGKLPADNSGRRGAVELAPGTYHLAGTLQMTSSGVVLRGSGIATILDLIGKPHMGIELHGSFKQQTLKGSTTLTDAYIPSGTRIIHVTNGSVLHAADTLVLTKPVTPAWVHFMGMDNLTRDGDAETWLDADIPVRRKVHAVSGNTVLLEVPLTDSFDSAFYPGINPLVKRVQVTGQVEEVGLENLKMVAHAQSINFREDAEYDGIHIDNAVDSWIRNVSFEDTTTSVRIERNVDRMTLQQIDVVDHDTVTSHAKPFFFSVNGTQILLDRCTGKGDKVSYIATQSRSEGPVVVLHCRFLGGGMIEGHQRWSTGLLVDGCDLPGGGIHLRNRGEMGSGHGWAIGWSVLWNNDASEITVQEPPGAGNWSIGDRGEQMGAAMPNPGHKGGAVLSSGIIESAGKHVAPASLYLEQLKERLGPGAITALGYQ